MTLIVARQSAVTPAEPDSGPTAAELDAIELELPL
ncbi:DUF6284 family protein, partial [Streptomyces sp. NPDC090029]